MNGGNSATGENAYQRHGYKDRSDYLAQTAESYEIDPYIVGCMAEVMGENEDFDGLIAELEDIGYYGYI